MRYLLICALLALALAQARAATATNVTFQPLASITNDRNADLQSLGVLLDAGQVVGLRFDTINGSDPHQSDFSIDDMKTGAVLDGDAKHEAIVLRGSIDSTAGKAALVVTYLSNGLFGKRRDCRADMVRDEAGQWHIVNIYDHQRVDHLVVQTWTLGISTIEGICPR
ncbi:MAG: hypothetical protein ACREUL_14820 [Steroidobacteraceae bacterium]